MPTASDLYLDLLKRCLTRLIFAEEDYVEVVLDRPGWQRWPGRAVEAVTRKVGVRLIHAEPPATADRLIGRDWPQHGETMVGLARLDNIQMCVEQVLADDVPGDLIETGVWRGGASIFMRGILAAHGVADRRVWLADSFAGLPPPDVTLHPADEGLTFHESDTLAVGVDEVKANFERYGLLDDQVRFLPGWFSETLPEAPVEQLAVLRLDGDMYGSTIDALEPLYPKLSVGGYVIVDDYHIDPCRKAVEDYRAAHGIDDEIVMIDRNAAYWRRSS
ncbi:MAG: TylF/MycF family methyltransferase [Acidimicrobiales bacterium]|nr:TylF/MycF family methyltransferase [Acidimicrobiales bacterium]